MNLRPARFSDGSITQIQNEEGPAIVPSSNLEGRQKEIREKTLSGKWIQDGLRHGMRPITRTRQDVYKVAHVLGRQVQTVKRHYMRSVKESDPETILGVTPDRCQGAKGGDRKTVRQRTTAPLNNGSNPWAI